MKVNITLLNLENFSQVERELKKIGCDSMGINIMKSKAIFKTIRVENIRSKAANLLKQTFLAKGAEVAITKGAADLSSEYTDALIVATLKQYRMAIAQLKMQPWGLPKLAEEIENVLHYTDSLPYRNYYWHDKNLIIDNKNSLVMGILDIVEESYDATNITKCIEKMYAEGVDIIDFVTEINNAKITIKEELIRLVPLLEKIIPYCKVPISIATYKSQIADTALQYGVNIINDLGGLQRDSAMAEVIGKYNVPVIINYNNEILSSDKMMKDIREFLQKSISIGIEKGIKSENMIINSGIGFCKNFEHTFKIMSEMEQLKTLGCPILSGTLIKKDIGQILELPINECMEGVTALVALGRIKGVQIHRVHDIKEVKRTLKMLDVIMRSEENDENFN